MPDRKSDEEWTGYASTLLKDLEISAVQAYKSNTFAVNNYHNNKKKLWTFWDSLVFCGTVYTTIGKNRNNYFNCLLDMYF